MKNKEYEVKPYGTNTLLVSHVNTDARFWPISNKSINYTYCFTKGGIITKTSKLKRNQVGIVVSSSVGRSLFITIRNGALDVVHQYHDDTVVNVDIRIRDNIIRDAILEGVNIKDIKALLML